jgi:hypothetical protein
MEWGATGAFLGVEGMYRGPEAMQEWMEVIRSAWEQFEVSLDEVLHDGDDLVVVTELLRGRGRGSGAEVEMRGSRRTGSKKGSSGDELPSPNGRQPSKPPGCRSSGSLQLWMRSGALHGKQHSCGTPLERRSGTGRN